MWCYFCGAPCIGIEFEPDPDLPGLRVALCWSCHRHCRVIFRTTAADRANVLKRWPGITRRLSATGLG